MTPTLVLVYLLGANLIGEEALNKGICARNAAIIAILWPAVVPVGIMAALIMGDR